MSLLSKLLGFGAIGVFLSLILLVILGQVTVRRLRRDPNLKGKLGMEFLSGYDIINVASALTTPKWLRDKLKGSPLSFLNADYQALYEATKPFERVLARIFWVFFFTSGFFIIILAILDEFGVFSTS